MSFNGTNIDLLCETQCGYNRDFKGQVVTPEQKLLTGMATEVPMTAAWCTVPLLFSPMAPYTKGYWQKLIGKSNTDKKYSELNKLIKEEQKALKEKNAFLSKDLTTGEKYSLRTRLGNKYKFNALNSFVSDIEKLEPHLTQPTTATRNGSRAISGEGKKAIETARQKYAEALRKINNIKNAKSATVLNQEYKSIIQLMQEGDVAINKAKMTGAIKPSSNIGKLGHAIKKGLGIYKAKGFMLKTSAGANALKGLKGWGKVGVGLAVITETLGEIPDLQSAKEIDKYERSQGRTSNRFKKQCGKSAVKVGCAVAGGVLGSMAAGAAVGAACGTVVPVVGNIVGFVGGAIGGLIGGFIGSKIAGESEADKYKKEQQNMAKKEAEKLKKEVRKDNNVRDELLISLNEAREAGKLDDKKVIKALTAELNARRKELEEIEKQEIKKIEEENRKAINTEFRKQNAYTAPTDAINWVNNSNIALNIPTHNNTPINFNIPSYTSQTDSIFTMPIQNFDINPFASANINSFAYNNMFMPVNEFNGMNFMF